MLANRIWQALKGILYDRTTPVQVVNSAYTTSASARPQYLSNGWIVTCVAFSGTGVRWYVSKDNGATFTRLCYRDTSATTGFSMVSFGTTIYTIFGTDAIPYFIKFDASIIEDTNVGINLALDSGQNSISGNSIAVNPTNGHLTATWSSKNATYPNSFNIRSAKSTDGGVTWTKQDGTAGVDQVTALNTIGQDNKNPCIVYMSNGRPLIVFDYSQPSVAYYIDNKYWNGSSWQGGGIYNAGSYAQSSPSATAHPSTSPTPNRIEVAWKGKDSTDSTYTNIRYSYSDDYGATWQTAVKLTTGNTYEQTQPCVTVDLNGNVHLLWTGYTSTSAGYYRGRYLLKTSSTWGGIVDLITTNDPQNLSSCNNYFNFEKPLFIYLDGANSNIKFYGRWTSN